MIEKILVEITSSEFPVEVEVEIVNDCEGNLGAGNGKLTTFTANSSPLEVNITFSPSCNVADLRFKCTDAAGCERNFLQSIDNPCLDFAMDVDMTELNGNITGTITTTDADAYFQWKDAGNNVIDRTSQFTLPNGSGNRFVRAYNQKGCVLTASPNFGELTALGFSFDVDDCETQGAIQINCNDLIQPNGLAIVSINFEGADPQHGTWSFVGAALLVYTPGTYFETAVTDTFQIEIVTSMGSAFADVDINYAICTPCTTVADMSFATNIDSGGYVTFVGSKDGIPNNPSNVSVDYLEYNIGAGWGFGDSLQRNLGFISFAKFSTASVVLTTTETEMTVNSELFGTLTTGTVVWKKRSDGTVLSTYNGGGNSSRNVTVQDMFDYDGVNAEVSYTFDDGYVFSQVLVFENPYASGTDTAAPSPNMAQNVYVRAGTQKTNQMRRTVTFTDSCTTLVTTYLLNLVDTTNIQDTPYLVATKI